MSYGVLCLFSSGSRLVFSIARARLRAVGGRVAAVVVPRIGRKPSAGEAEAGGATALALALPFSLVARGR